MNKLLRKRMIDCEVNQGDLARLIHISMNSMSAKMNGVRTWKYDEISRITEALSIPHDKVWDYFFAK